MGEMAIDNRYIDIKKFGYSASLKPKVKFDAARGTMVGLASLVTFAPYCEADPADDFMSSFGHLATIVQEIEESDKFTFVTTALSKQRESSEVPMYVEFLEDFDSSEIESIHLETARKYGW